MAASRNEIVVSARLAASANAITSALRAAGFVEAAVRDRLELPAQGDDYPAIIADAFMALSPNGEPACDSLIKLFIFGRPCVRATIERILPTDVLSALESAGVLEIASDRISSTLQILPLNELYLGCDFQSWGSVEDIAWRPHYSSLALQRMIQPVPGEPVERCLDLGTGSGFLALSAWKAGFRHNLGIDLSRRSIAVASFNAVLNQAVDCRFAVASAEELSSPPAFDLVLFNFPSLFIDETVDNLALRASSGGDLFRRTCAQVASLVTENGRIAFFHQSPPSDPDFILRTLMAAGLQDRFRALRAEGRGRAPFGLTLLERADHEDPRFLRISRTGPVDRFVLEQRWRTRLILAKPRDQLLRKRATRAPELSFVRQLDLVGQELIAKESFIVEGRELSDAAVELLVRCTGDSIETILSHYDAEDRDDYLACLRQLAERDLVALD
jgi:release factor glutamine methyltransferase